MRVDQSQAIANGIEEMMFRKGRLVPLPSENETYDYDPADVRACSEIAGREIMKEAYKQHFDGFLKLVNQYKLEIGKNMISEGHTELGNNLIAHNFTQDEIYDMMFAALSPAEKEVENA